MKKSSVGKLGRAADETGGAKRRAQGGEAEQRTQRGEAGRRTRRGKSKFKTYKKLDFPVEQVRRFLEPGPIVLVSSQHKGETNIMTMGWHMVMEFSPSLVACIISSAEHSFELVSKSRECVINIPTTELAETAVQIGNSSGTEIDKFLQFGLTPTRGKFVKAPLIAECYASFECKLVDTTLMKKYSLFIFEIVKAHVPQTPKFPKTIHYRGDGQFMVSGSALNLRRLFKPAML